TLVALAAPVAPGHRRVYGCCSRVISQGLACLLPYIIFTFIMKCSEAPARRSLAIVSARINQTLSLRGNRASWKERNKTPSMERRDCDTEVAVAHVKVASNNIIVSIT